MKKSTDIMEQGEPFPAASVFVNRNGRTALCRKEDDAATMRLLSCLKEKERKVIFLRFGIESDPMTLKDIGIMIGVSSQRVRHIESKAFRKMRHPLNLNPFLIASGESKIRLPIQA